MRIGYGKSVLKQRHSAHAQDSAFKGAFAALGADRSIEWESDNGEELDAAFSPGCPVNPCGCNTGLACSLSWKNGFRDEFTA